MEIIIAYVKTITAKKVKRFTETEIIKIFPELKISYTAQKL